MTIKRRIGDNGAQSPSIESSQEYFHLYQQVVSCLPHAIIQKVADELLRVHTEGRTVFLFGNGGSAALASHFACDLAKGTLIEGYAQHGLRAVALTDNVALITAWANDRSYQDVFAEQIKNLILPGDVAFAISGSGNSPNVLRALEAARALGARTIGLTGFRGGKMKALCDHCIVVPSDSMQIIEDLHLGVAHALFLVIRNVIRHSLTFADRAHA
jgi:D-sedoheptulose 7-phosphate isomerase